MKSEREVAQSCLTLCDPMDCSLPGSSVHEIFQARVLEWGATVVLICIFLMTYEVKHLSMGLFVFHITFAYLFIDYSMKACGILVPEPEIEPRP